MNEYRDESRVMLPDDVGIVFVGPIIGLPDSLMAVFAPLEKQGVPVEGVSIYDAEHEKKTTFKVLGLTLLPGKDGRLVRFANKFNEHAVFDRMNEAINKLLASGKTRIVLGGMSGGFVFASRAAQMPVDKDLARHPITQHARHFAGVFGISPIVRYPEGIRRQSADLRALPSSIRALTVFGDADQIIPSGTIEYCEEVSKERTNIETRILRHNAYSSGKPVRHQFFGGTDYVGFMKNIFWHQEAEQAALDLVRGFILQLPR